MLIKIIFTSKILLKHGINYSQTEKKMEIKEKIINSPEAFIDFSQKIGDAYEI